MESRMGMMFDKSIFIVGCCNSGTTILFNTLRNQHPQLGGFNREIHNFGVLPVKPGENPRLYALTPSFERLYADSGNKIEGVDGLVGRDETLQRLKDLSGTHKDFDAGERLIFKDPRLALRVKWIRDVFPSSYIVHIVRNPFGVVEGIKRRTDGESSTPSAIAQWLIANALIELDSRGMDRFVTIRYEDMIQGGATFLSNLLNFLDLDDFDFDMTKFSKTANADSRARLPEWDKDLIDYMTKGARGHYGYE